MEKMIYKLAKIVEEVPANPIAAAKLGLKKLRENRENNIIEDILNEVSRLDIEELKAEDFFSRFDKIYRVLKKSYNNEKTKLLKCLFINSLKFYSELDEDNYDLYIDIIENTTYKEFIILKIINDKEKSVKKELENTIIEKNLSEEKEIRDEKDKIREQKSKEAEDEIINTLEIEQSLIKPYVARLKGKVLIDITEGWSSGGLSLSFAKGEVSTLFDELVKFLGRY